MGLAAVAVSQPLLQLFGDNPDFFVAARADASEILGFAIVIALGPPVVVAMVDFGARAVSRMLGMAVHSALVGILAALLGCVVLRQLEVGRAGLFLGIAVALGVMVAVAERRARAVRLGLRYIALSPLVFLAFFLGASGTSSLIWEHDASAVEGIEVRNPHDVVVIVVDELPVSSLVTAHGEVNAERYPGFGSLASQSDWFRNATAVAPVTPMSVPAILTGDSPDEFTLPTSADHPRNLFTLLGEDYDLRVTETATQLCPESLCRSGETARSAGRGITNMVADAGVAYGHLALPPAMRRRLPPIDQTAGGFAESTGPPDLRQFMQDRTQERSSAGDLPGDSLERFIRQVQPGPAPRLFFEHDLEFVHYPWLLTPDGRPYYPPDDGLPGLVDQAWTDDEFLVRQGQQRHLLQVGWADTLMAALERQMRADGSWDDTLVIVTSDHGVSFEPGTNRRKPEDANVHEVYRVPLFVKLPGQRQGTIRDDSVTLADVLPTIIDVLDIETDWTFDGRSLLAGEPRADEEERSVFHGSGPDRISGSVDGLFGVVRRDQERFPRGDGWHGVLAVGRLGRFVGQSVDRIDLNGEPRSSWTLDHPERYEDVAPRTGPLPLVVSGRLQASGGEAPSEGLVAVNGVVAGVAGAFTEGDDGFTFSALVDWRLFRAGENELMLLVPDDGPGSQAFGLVPLADE